MTDAIKLFASRLSLPADFASGGRSIALPSLTGCADAFLALALTGNDAGPVLALTPGIPDADRLTDDLRLLTKTDSTRILEFPPRIPDDTSALGLRLKTLAALRAWSISPYPCVVVAPFAALATPLPATPISALQLSVGPQKETRSRKMAELVEQLVSFGYRRVPLVGNEGEFSVRGGILDVWSPGEGYPVRAEFFGDDLESLRTFDAATQLSIERIDGTEIMPAAAEKAPNDETPTASLIELLPVCSTVLALEHNIYPVEQAIDPAHPPQTVRLVTTGDPAPSGVLTVPFQTAPLPGFAELGADEAHHPELFEAAKKRLEQHLAAAEKRNITLFREDGLSNGFELPDTLVVVTKADRVFTKKKAHVRETAANFGQRLTDFDTLEPGEYVVHIDYGIGRYVGATEISVDGTSREVFTIEYADGAKLHVPATHAHLLSRYVGVHGEKVHLHRLDGTRWAKEKKDAQKAVADLASSLLETQAKRATVPGYSYDVNCDGLDAFEAAFPYDETPDQISAIAAVKKDLAEQKPMDRLICGDAGYGKTEVAMRAAYIAVLNGRQVAVLAPTTVLAEQHFETFTSRFDGTPVRIEAVSRFQSSGTHNGTFSRIANGVCDIVIGTHAILTKKIAFHDLGLIIVDEEQRFGVRQKEFLKSIRATADVLTLSATPIPRTLYLSMTGTRDLSLLRTPPRERVAVETRIVRDTDETIRSAIESELQRGGQVFFLHNRVMSIDRVERRLRGLCPSARIVVAHGQLDAVTLATKMRAFERGEYDILLSTTIIESGIDIPRANTILIDRADTFGMADLYQLRGRVGRSSQQGRAFCLLPASGDIDSDARERLRALKRHGGLGGGFNLAMRDLELRGAGNLLGAQQSGHIAAVGFGLYCQLLQRTIARLKGERVKAIVDVQLNLDFATPRLPYDYIEEDVQRFALMKRFAEAQDERAVKKLALEMQDRYGPLPDEARVFVRIATLRIVCAAVGICHIDTRGRNAYFYRDGSREISFSRDLTESTPMRKLADLMRIVRDDN